MEDREKLIREKLKEEELIDMMQLRGIKQIIWEMLIIEKGFYPEEIEIDPEFRIQLSDCEANVSVDFIINLSSLSFMVIRSVSTAIESWERYIIAFARAVKDYEIPYAMVTDGENARIYNVLSRYLIGDSIKGLFNRQEALNLMKDFWTYCPSVLTGLCFLHACFLAWSRDVMYRAAVGGTCCHYHDPKQEGPGDPRAFVIYAQHEPTFSKITCPKRTVTWLRPDRGSMRHPNMTVIAPGP